MHTHILAYTHACAHPNTPTHHRDSNVSKVVFVYLKRKLYHWILNLKRTLQSLPGVPTLSGSGHWAKGPHVFQILLRNDLPLTFNNQAYFQSLIHKCLRVLVSSEPLGSRPPTDPAAGIPDSFHCGLSSLFPKCWFCMVLWSFDDGRYKIIPH